MSPPADRMDLMVDSSIPPRSGRLPSQAGLHPPPERTKAIVNDLIPVVFITCVAAGGSPQPRYRYGAAATAAPTPVDFGGDGGDVVCLVAAEVAADADTRYGPVVGGDVSVGEAVDSADTSGRYGTGGGLWVGVWDAQVGWSASHW